MAQFVQVPVDQLAMSTLMSLLEEYATRDGTDYGHREHSLEDKTAALKRQLDCGDLTLVYDLDSEEYDLCDPRRLKEFTVD